MNLDGTLMLNSYMYHDPCPCFMAITHDLNIKDDKLHRSAYPHVMQLLIDLDMFILIWYPCQTGQSDMTHVKFGNVFL